MSKLSEVAPRIGRAYEAERAELMRGITRCWQNGGFHTAIVSGCFDTPHQAAAVRDRAERDYANRKNRYGEWAFPATRDRWLERQAFRGSGR